jgi:hypothetical protein
MTKILLVIALINVAFIVYEVKRSCATAKIDIKRFLTGWGKFSTAKKNFFLCGWVCRIILKTHL